MKKILKGLVPGLLIITLATPGFAENRSGAVTVSPFVGGYLLDKEQQEENRPIFGLRGGYNFTKSIGAEAMFGYSLTEKKESYGSKETDLYRYGVDILYHFMPDNKFVPFIAVGGGGTNFNTPSTPSAKSHYAGLVDYGVGFKYFVADNVALRGDVRHAVLIHDTGDNNLEYSAGLTFQFGGKEKVAALPVVCPPVPEPVPAPKLVEPLPVPPATPTAALIVTPASISRGQSAIINWKSENASGCEIQPDIGPVPPEGVRTIKPASSTSYKLVCSGASGRATSTVNVAVVLSPPPIPAPITPKAAAAAKRFCNKPAVLEINFDTNKTDIKPRYHDELKTVGEFLMYFPNAKGEISGHTDSVGSNEFNQKLSERRAESVEKYISKTFGIHPDRITTKGYGETKPIASNKTKAGKAKNRRIEANFTCE
jgi:OmpA-OmpF porin, OOP family